MQAAWTRHKRSNKAERNRIIDEYRRSDLTQREFTDRAGLGLSTLQAWLRRAEADRSVSRSAQFVALPNLTTPASNPPTYRLKFADGKVLEIPADFDAEELARLVQLLQRV